MIISLIILMIVPSILFSDILVRVFLGHKWIFIIPTVKLFFVLGGIYILNNFFNSLIISLGYPKSDSIIKLIALIIFFSLIPFSKNLENIIINLFCVTISILFMNFFYIYF